MVQNRHGEKKNENKTNEQNRVTENDWPLDIYHSSAAHIINPIHWHFTGETFASNIFHSLYGKLTLFYLSLVRSPTQWEIRCRNKNNMS